MARGSLRLRVASADLKPGAPVAVSIRPHQIELLSDQQAETAAGRGGNLLPGVVHRVSYLGDGVDYQVRVEGSDVILRVAAPPSLRFQLGEAVSLAVAPAACVPLTEGDT